MDFLRKSLPFVIIILFAGFLRFYNLGYSEFQDDEKKAFIRKGVTTSTYEFFMSRRKGPIQFLVTSTTLLFVGDPRNELLIRLPFTILNICGVVIFYLILKELFKSELVSVLGALLFAINGFIVGFSRIAQYQNLNILFSLLSVFFFIKLTKSPRKYLFSMLGTFCFSISLLSHWDAVFFLPPIIYFYSLFLVSKDTEKVIKIRITVKNILLGCILLLPFLIPYVYNQLSNPANIDYFNRRIGLDNYSLDKHKFIFELYNPYVTIYFLPILAYLGLFNKKKGLLLGAWFFLNFAIIFFFMEKPGTHIYNYVIPAIFLAVSGISLLHKNKNVFIAFLPPLIIALVFLFYQSYVIFVDNAKEYPWDENEILTIENARFITKEYNGKEILTFGFPHFRNWKKVNEIISNDPDNCTYITNEGKEISQIYVDAKYGIFSNRPCYYIADVIKPFNTRGNGAIFAKVSGKDPVYVYKRDGEKLLKLYKIYTK